MQLQHKEMCLGQHMPYNLGQKRRGSMKLHAKAMLVGGLQAHTEVSILQKQKDYEVHSILTLY